MFVHIDPGKCVYFQTCYQTHIWVIEGNEGQSIYSKKLCIVETLKHIHIFYVCTFVD